MRTLSELNRYSVLATPLPSKIQDSHIIDSVVEVRFVPNNEKTSFVELLGIVKHFVPNYKLVSSDIPRKLRQTDPQFHFAVEATLIGERFSIGIGFNTIVFNCQGGYKSWNEFFPLIHSVLTKCGNEIKAIVRIGVRFTNFFEGMNDLSRFNVSFGAGKNWVNVSTPQSHQMVLKFTTVSKEISYNVTIANQALLPKSAVPGTLIDVDAFLDDQGSHNLTKGLFDLINYTHHKEKEMFFSLLEDRFLQELKPSYNN